MHIDIPAEPFAYSLPARGSTALLLIDMQRDFILPGGFGETLGNDVSRLQDTVAAAACLLALCRERDWPVFHTRESHDPSLSDCPDSKRLRGEPTLRIGDPGPMGRILIRGEYGTDFVPECAPVPGETVIDKPGKGAFYATRLHTELRELGISHLVVGGVTTEVCVQTTMREANDRGYTCLLIEEATDSYFPEFKQATLAMIRAQGAIVGWTTTLECFADALARHDTPTGDTP